MELTGKIVQIMTEQTGTGKNGPWKKQEFVVETQEQYPKKVCITAWGDKINLHDLKTNDPVKVAINLESREYNGKWYTDVKAWRLEKLGSMPSTPVEGAFNNSNPQQNEVPVKDDLPF